MSPSMIRPDPESPLDLDRRSHERHLCSRRRTAQVIARPSLQSRQVVIHDFSMNGLGILSERPYPAGATLAIELRSAQAGISCVLSAIVKHSTQLGDEVYLIGCSLSRGLTDVEVHALM